MPELQRQVLALACLSRPRTFGGNGLSCAGRRRLGDFKAANLKESSHLPLLADKDHPLLRGNARAGQMMVATSVCGGCAEAAMRPFRNRPKSVGNLDKSSKTTYDCFGLHIQRGVDFRCRGGRRFGRTGAGWDASGVAVRNFWRFP